MKRKKARKVKITIPMTISALLTILFLFLINGICISGDELKDTLVILSSFFIMLTPALFVIGWLEKVKKDIKNIKKL